MSTDRAIVVKLGGSLTESGRIGKVLDILTSASRPAIVVPGGGAFADAVRAAQKSYRFDDAAAHRMALLAMHQSAMLLAALSERLMPAESIAAIHEATAGGNIPVWMPFKMVVRDRSLAANWTTTSDTLAARLAERLRLPLVLVKTCRVPKRATAEDLSAAGIVDEAFAGIIQRARLEWYVFGAGDERRLIDLLVSTTRPARRAAPARAIARR